MLDSLNSLDFSNYFKEARKEAAPPREYCRVSFRDGGGELRAEIVAYDEQNATIRVIPEGADSGQTIPMGKVRMLRFDRHIHLEANHTHFLDRSIPVHAIGRRVPFSLAFRDGRVFTGELLGYCFSPAGLGIYLADESGPATRCFVPGEIVDDFTIGLPLGKVLLDGGHLTEAGLEAALETQRALRAQRIGDILAEKHVIDQRSLEEALQTQARKPHLKIGQVLVEMGIIDAGQLEYALEEQAHRRGKQLGEILIEMGLLDGETVKEALAQKLGVPHVSLERFHVDREAFKSIPAKVIVERQVVPLYRADEGLVVAMANPFDAGAVNALRFASRSKIIPVLASRKEIMDFLSRNRPDGIAIWQHKHEGEHLKGFT